MRKVQLAAAMIFLLLSCGCRQQTDASADWEKSLLGQSASCSEPPAIFKWAGGDYKLVQRDPTAEPGMKFGFVKCDKGRYTLGDDGPNTLIVYSNGDPRTNQDLMLFGPFGRTLYTKQP